MGFGQGDDDALVVHDVFNGQAASTVAFQPFLCGLVSADIKIPCYFWHATEILVIIDPDAAILIYGLDNFMAKHIVTEQLYPESRGWVEHEFESEEDAMEWLKNLRGRVI